jgi:hypothetical protein
VEKDSDVGLLEHKVEPEQAAPQSEADCCLQNPDERVVDSYREALSQQLDSEDEQDQRGSESGGKFHGDRNGSVVQYFLVLF